MGKKLDDYEVKTSFEQFFNAKMSNQIRTTAAQYPENRSIGVDYNELSKFDTLLADELIEHPDTYLRLAQKSIEGMDLPTSTQEKFSPHVRIHNLPSEHVVTVQNLGAEHLNKLVSVEGVITLITQIFPRMHAAIWMCVHCNETAKTYPEKNNIPQPEMCRCGRRDFKLLEESSQYINMQRSQIQDPVEKIKGNVPAPQVDLWLEDDLTNVVSPGENVAITGVLRLRQLPAKGKAKTRNPVYAKFFDVMHVHQQKKEFEELEISKDEEKQIIELSQDKNLFEKIVASIAPSIYGYNEMKEAIALQLFGGTPNKELPDGKKIRSDMHILLIGDPGCLVADERVILGNGAITKIGELGTKHLQDLNLQVQTGTGGGKRDLATKFHVYEKQPVIEIITESGKSIQGTRNHPLLCLGKENGRVKRFWRRLDNFQIGDRIATITGFKCTITKPVPTNFKPQKRKHGPKFKGKLPPSVNVDLACFLGYVLGDGWVQKYRVGFVAAENEKDILKKLEKKVKTLFGIKAKTIKRTAKNRTVPLYYANIGSEDIAFNLSFLKEKRVPDLILKSGNNVASKFLKWLFEADGTVFNKGRGKRAIGLKAKNIELLRDVQILLLRFGVHSRIIENALLIRRGSDIIKFSKKIGFASRKKTTKLKELAKEAEKFKRAKTQRSEKIVKINVLPPTTVYDIEVPNTHRFIANGIISHNTAKSTILQYIRDLAPKAIYVAGRGASGVGLTASAEKDELADGGWVLKAGALVLASGGIVMIDEFDKMEKDDRSAIHESLEQQSISIAKAGIVTSFKTKTSVLAAANPKFGRFDPMQPPATQFEIPPTLMSRFDLIFAIKDVLDESRDKGLAEHVLLGHRHAAEKTKPPQDSEILPAVDLNLLRKYIAYARRKAYPVLSDEASNRIKDYYLELRRLGRKQNNYPVTAREIEGLIRLSEASAKLRLSKKVKLQDSERAIRLSEFVLNEIFMDK
ncbi:MAG: LAGLIDADG family homing endonuclease [Candidatus Micrarchaeia archaeon]